VYDNPFAGVALHAVGGVAQGTFYAPLKKVRNWAWESAWLVQGIAAWIITPWLVAQFCGSHPWVTLSQSPTPILLRTFLFGMMWGAGSLTFGLSVRYLGMSLGMAVALGYTVSIGTLVPPVLKGQMTELLRTPGGRLMLLGVIICLLGIAFCGWAGIRREHAQPAQVSSSVRPRLLVGFLIATFSGLTSSGFALGIQSAQPIAQVALAKNAPFIFQNSPGFVVIMSGGFLVNGLWCLFLILRNRSIGDLIGRRSVKPMDWGGVASADASIGRALVPNYGWAAVAGVIWYLGFMFYGIGTTFMGRYDFTSWSIHLAFVIVFSTLCGIASGEWRGADRVTRWLLAGAIVILVSSTLVIAIGGRVASQAVH
jgi:L-rhamnose-H+ transport protein